MRVVTRVSDSFTVLWTYDNKKRTKQASLLASATMPSTKTHIRFLWFQREKLLSFLITAAPTNKPATGAPVTPLLEGAASWDANQEDQTFLTFCPQPPSPPQLIQLEQDHWLFQDPREERIPEFHQNPLSVEAVVFSGLAHLWIFQFLRRCSFNTGAVREEVGRWIGWRRLPEEEDGRNLPAPTLPSATHTFRPTAADQHPAREQTLHN